MQRFKYFFLFKKLTFRSLSLPKCPNCKASSPNYILLFVTFLLSACNFAPKQHTPDLKVTGKWASINEYVTNEILIDKWWESFADPQLNLLVEQAALNNYDVKIALENIRLSRVEKNIATAALLPEIEYNASATKVNTSGNAAFLRGQERKDYESAFDASWELDLWGGIRNRRSSAKNQLLADIQEKRAVTLSVIAETVRNYIELRGYQKQQKIIKRNIELLDKTMRLTKIQQEAGIASSFDVARIKSEKEIIEATEPAVKAAIYTAKYRLSLLLGKKPDTLDELLTEQTALPEMIDPIPVGLPATLLQRRPDILQAEYLLRSENKEIGAAIADFFPSFSLTGSAGNTALRYSDLFHSSSANWNYGAAINLPIFQGGALVNAFKQAKIDKNIAVLNYEKTVVTALSEVETNLVNYAQEVLTYKRLLAAEKNSERLVDIARERYKAGYDALLDVIAAERNLIDIRNSLIASEIQYLTNLVALYKSLGGGV